MIRIQRIRDAFDRFGDAFLCRIFTPQEVVDCEKRGVGRISSLAVRFAAKEAVSKALGTGIGREGVIFRDIEVVSDDRGNPSIRLHNLTESFFLKRSGETISISLSHDGDMAVAFCVMKFKEDGHAL